MTVCHIRDVPAPGHGASRRSHSNVTHAGAGPHDQTGTFGSIVSPLMISSDS